ncbi:putative isotrichodermin C-15 hydroxylase [Cercophora samala]|uniref:Isotrichodermin C-15 hydroxylase n=1 Tax=Cercophora samala TaxID=330535 RepID=A0AA40DDW7_9PEZI|nr:putative isotrichodermin C-15 hydroxylase [Cercophora samala]
MATMLLASLYSSVGAIGVIVAGALSIFLLRSIYHAFLHPLSKVPGPKLYSFWDLPYLYHLLRGSWPHKLKQLHDTYGPVVRFTTDNVSFTTPEAWKAIYGHRHAGQETYQKDFTAYRPTTSGHPHIVVANDLDHRRQRRLLSHAFSEKALRAQEDIMKHYIDLFISKLTAKAHSNETIDIVQWFNFTTFDLIGDLAFGQPFGCLESGGYHPWISMIFNNVKLGVFFELLQRHPVLAHLKTLLLPAKLVNSHKEHWALTQQTAKQRLQTGNTDREDFMSYILRHNDEKGMTEGEIVENSNILIIAGSETTATQLSGTTFYLLKNRDKYERLVKEIRGRFEKEDEIDLVGVGGLEYLDAVFEEGFRIYPPTPLALPRRVPPKGENIEGYWIPGNTSVAVPQWASYQSSANFRDPTKFAPERWLGDPKYADDVRAVLQPFSVGPRNCIGKNLAYAEMRLILARLLWNFDLELMPESENWSEQKIYMLWQKGALNVRLAPVVRGEGGK